MKEKNAFNYESFFDPNTVVPVSLRPLTGESRYCVLNLPLEKRVAALLSNNQFMSVFNNVAQDALAHTRKAKIKIFTQLKNKFPQAFQDSSKNSVELTEEEISQEMRRIADIFMKTCFSEEEMMAVSHRLLDPEQKLTLTDLGMLKIGIAIRQNELEGLEACFGPQRGVFPALLFQNAINLTDLIGASFKEDPRSILRYGLLSFRRIRNLDEKVISKRADIWTANWLDETRLKLLLSAKTLKPHLPSKELASEKKEQEKIRRYQHDFKMMLLRYLEKVPAGMYAVFTKIVPFLEKMEIDIQKDIWAIMFQKMEGRPDIQKDMVSHISRFLERSPSPSALKAFYHTFVKQVPFDTRSEMIGTFNPKALKRYWNAFKDEKSIVHAKIKVGNDEEYLRWKLFNDHEISDEDMALFLKKLDLKKYKDFIFSEKKRIDKDLFMEMSAYFSGSNYYFWRWIKSFQKVPNFTEELAKLYPFLPESIKRNPFYVVAMNNHFDLIRQCAFLGDTGSLSILKNVLGKDIFWRHLTKAKEGQISGLSSLCQQRKRGLLKLIANMSLSEQQRLLKTPDINGKCPLDFCSDNFLRMVSEKVFQHQYVKKEISPPKEEVSIPVKQEKISQQPTSTGKAKYPRRIFKLPYFEKCLERQQTVPGLSQDVEQVMEDLSTMSGLRIQAELREGWKKNGSLEKLVVKDIRGNDYRLGYSVQGNADKNQGKIAFLFLWTHAQYNSLLNKQGRQLVNQATSLMDSAPLVNPLPSVPNLLNPGNGGR